MSKDFIKLSFYCLRKIFELAIKSPDNPVNIDEVRIVAAIDKITVGHIMAFLEGHKFILPQNGGCVTITIKGMDKVVNDNIHKYCEELNITLDPTYYP